MKMLKKILLLAGFVGILAVGLYVKSAYAAQNVFPQALNNWEFGDVIEEDWANALENAIGVTGSAITTSLNYLVNHIAPSQLTVNNAPTDEYCLTYELTGTTFEWQNCSSGGSGTVSTSTVPTVGHLAFWTGNGFPSTLGSVATTTLTASSPLSLSQPINVLGGSASVLSLSTAGDWTGTFDGQEGSYYLDAKNLTNFGNPFYQFFNATTTTALAEGTNLYWTNTRFDNRLSASSSIAGITTLPNLSLPISQTTGFATAFDNRLSASSSISGITTLPNLSLPFTQLSGSLGQGWLHTTGNIGATTASTSPTVNYITATSTTASSTLPKLDVTTLGVTTMANFADTVTSGIATTSKLVVTDTGARSVVFKGTVRSELTAPGVFFSAPNSGLSNYQIFTMDSSVFSTASINLPAVLSQLAFTVGDCSANWTAGQAIGTPFTNTVSNCDVIQQVTGTFRSYTLTATRNLNFTGSGTSTTAFSFTAGATNVANFSSTTINFLNSRVQIGTTTLVSTRSILELFTTATTSITVDSNSTTQGGCLAIKDTDGSGYTYVVANNGVLTASTNTCKTGI